MNTSKNQTTMQQIDHISIDPTLATPADVAGMAAMIQELEEILHRISKTCEKWHEENRAWKARGE